MANLNGEVIFRVTFKDLNIPVGLGYTSGILFHECAKQVYAHAPWNKISDQKKGNFKVEMISKKLGT